MNFQGVIKYPLLSLGVSQLYISEDKLRAIRDWFSPDNMSIFQPLKVHDYGNGRYTIVDGHSRAYMAYENGIDFVPIVYDDDEIVSSELAQKLYLADIGWCERFHIKNIINLKNRIVSGAQYEMLWRERCDRSYDLLTQTTENERKLMQQKASNLFLYGSSEDLLELYYEDFSGNLYIYKNGLLSVEADDN